MSGGITLTGRRPLTLPGPRLADKDRGTEGLNAMGAHVSWHEVAACRDTDPDLFFPVGTAGPALRQIEEAKRICRACPVQAACLAWALDHGVDSGVWGGATEAERRALRQHAMRNQPSAQTTTMRASDRAR
jgi:WhiB family transcriptional regulator, redox-sensing transcriptional regulator